MCASERRKGKHLNCICYFRIQKMHRRVSSVRVERLKNACDCIPNILKRFFEHFVWCIYCALYTILNAYQSLRKKPKPANDFITSAYDVHSENLCVAISDRTRVAAFFCFFLGLWGFECKTKSFFYLLLSVDWSNINRMTKGKTGLTTNQFG